MLQDIKKELLAHPDKIIELLEHFEYHNIVNHNNSYITFGRSVDSSKKSIVIRLEKNESLFVKDYARNQSYDIFTFIIKNRHVEFKEVLNEVRHLLGITDYYTHFNNRGAFGGFYGRIKTNNPYNLKTYDKSILNQYSTSGNIRFLKDHISLDVQKKFHIGYDIENQGITIPIYDELGELIGIKERTNKEVKDDEQKYWYPVPCSASQTLYGYFQNYEYLQNGVVLIGESEKFVLQAYSYGYKNAVGLGSGSVSSKQAKMLLALSPRKIILMHDTLYGKEYIIRNVNTIKRYSKFSECQIGYWNWFGKPYADKVSPTDLGKKTFINILTNEIEYVKGDDIDEI